jgi:hypothetical protein
MSSHGRILRQGVDADRGAGMHAGLAEDTMHQVRRRIGRFALLREIAGALHVHADAQDFLDRIDASTKRRKRRRAALGKIDRWKRKT